MARGQTFNGQFSGKAGGYVYYVVGGKQLVRVNAQHVRNPKTEAQAWQRMKYGAAQKFCNRFRSTLANSYEGKSGAEALRYFVSKAAEGNGFTFGMEKEDFGFMPEAYQVSVGSLDPNNAICENGSAVLPCTSPTTNTMAAFLLRNSRFRVNDTLTIVAVVSRGATIEPRALQVVVDSFTLANSVQDIANMASADGWFSLDLMNGGILDYNPAADIIAIAIITNRGTDTPSHSTENIYIDPAIAAAAEAWNEAALPSYLPKSRTLVSSLYLQKAR